MPCCMRCAVTGFYDAVRQYILHTVSSTFQTLPKASLAVSLKSDGATLDNLVNCWLCARTWRSQAYLSRL